MIVFDAILAASILGSAAVALFAREAFSAVLAFLVTGLLVALSWARLGAPDVALAEAAIGAGLSTVLFLQAARRQPEPAAPRLSLWYLGTAALLALCAGGGVAYLAAMSETRSAFPALVQADLAQTGVSNPVTAVLLNYRAWDTLLEMAVLLVALALFSLLAPRPTLLARTSEMIRPFARFVVPLCILFSGHLLWNGSSAPGGAFQAGALSAGGLMILVLAGYLKPQRLPRRVMMVAACFGLAVFVGAALGTEWIAGTLMTYPQGLAKALILIIESALTLSIAVTLVLLFTGHKKEDPA